MNTNIPKIIHGIWFGPEMPSEFRRFYEGWKQLHPDWQIKLWSLEDVQRLPLICTLPFRYIRELGQLSDIARYEILRIHGGFYLDLDIELFRSLEPLRTANARLVYADHSNGNPNNCLIGCTPQHPAMIALCSQINRDFPFLQKGREHTRKLDYKFATTLAATGPHLFTDVTIRFFGRDQPIKHTELGFMIGEPNSYHSTLAIWSDLLPPGKRMPVANSFGHHKCAKTWHKRREESDELVIYNETLCDNYGIAQIPTDGSPLIIDAGAHRGLFAASCRKMWPGSTVISIEPNPTNLIPLSETAYELDAIIVIPAALGYENSDGKFRTDAGHSARGLRQDDGDLAVEVKTLSSIIRDVALYRPIDLLKIDIEGAEAEVLRDLKDNNMLSDIRHVRLETHDYLVPGIAEQCMRLLSDTHEIVYSKLEKAGLIYADRITP